MNDLETILGAAVLRELDAGGYAAVKAPTNSNRELAGHNRPLAPTNDRRELLVAAEREEQAPHELAAAEDPLVPYHLPLRLSQVQALKRMKLGGRQPAQFVRDLVARGLEELEAR